jgi:hypothetical protein
MFHHNPLQCPNKEFAPLTTVHIADAMEKRPVAGVPHALLSRLDKDYLALTGAWPKIPMIRKALEKSGPI